MPGVPRSLAEVKELEEKHKKAPWTPEETEALHEMVRDYMWARTFRKKASWWALWLLGVPGAALAFWEPMQKLFILIGWKVK